MSALRDSENADISLASGTLKQDFVYTHPTIIRMARVLVHLGFEHQTQDTTHKDLIGAWVEEYTTGIPIVTKAQPPPKRITVLLTGSTGHLGTHVLLRLLQDERVARIYAFNRPSHKCPTLRHEFAFRDQ
jgi:hypothetical protein